MAFTKRIKRYPKNRSSRRNRKSYSKKRYKGGAQPNAGPVNINDPADTQLSYSLGTALVNQTTPPENDEQSLRMGPRKQNAFRQSNVTNSPVESQNPLLNGSRVGSLNVSPNGSPNGSPVGSMYSSLNVSPNDSQKTTRNSLKNVSKKNPSPPLPPRSNGSTAPGLAATPVPPLPSVIVPTADTPAIVTSINESSSVKLKKDIENFIARIKTMDQNDDYVKEIVPKLYEIMENIKARNPQFVLPTIGKYVISYKTLREKQPSIKKLLDDYDKRNNHDRLVKADDPVLFDLLKTVYTICTSKPTSSWPF
jgi:hypothetical protein